MRALPFQQSRLIDALPFAIAIPAAIGIGVFIPWAIEGERWKLVMFVAAVAFAPIALRWPVTLAFGAYAFVLPFDSVSLVADTGGATVGRLIGIAAAGTMLAVGVVQRRLVRPPVAALWAVLFLLWGVTTLAWSVDLESAPSRLMTAASLVAMYVAAVSFKVTKKELRTVCLFLMLGGALASVAGVVVGFDADAKRGRATMSMGETEANPNRVASSLVLPLAAAIATFFIFRSLWMRAAAVAAVTAIAAGIFLTMSRGALVAVVVMIGVLLFRFRARWQILTVMASLIAVLPLMPDRFFERIQMVFTGVDATGAGRTEIWRVGLQALPQFGFFGGGLGSFPAVFSMYSSGRVAGHNTFLTTWIEMGIVGVALLFALIVAHLRMGNARDGAPSTRALPAAIEAAAFAILFLAVFGDVLWYKIFWMTWTLIVWASRAEPGPSAT